MNSSWIAAACSLAALAAGCWSPVATATATGDPAGGAVVRRADFQPRILLTGELEAVRAETITVPRTPAWQVQIRWLAEDGARVVKGDRVLELDNSQFTGDLEQKRLSESKAGNDLARKEADVAADVADKEFEVERRRIEMEKTRLAAAVPERLRSRREHQDSLLALSRAEHEWRKAQEDLAAARRAAAAEVEELRVALERTRDEIRAAEEAIGALTLYAPRDGILVIAEHHDEGRKYQVGDSVWVGRAVMRIPDLTAMNVAARLIDVDDGSIAVGMRARCTLDTYPDREHDGEIVEIAPIAQEESDRSLRRSFRVVVRLDESDPERMRPGMSVRVEVLPPPIEQVLIAPRTALDLEVDPPRATLADGSTADLQLGPCGPFECVVGEGLSEGTVLRSVR